MLLSGDLLNLSVTTTAFFFCATGKKSITLICRITLGSLFGDFGGFPLGGLPHGN